MHKVFESTPTPHRKNTHTELKEGMYINQETLETITLTKVSKKNVEGKTHSNETVTLPIQFFTKLIKLDGHQNEQPLFKHIILEEDYLD